MHRGTGIFSVSFVASVRGLMLIGFAAGAFALVMAIMPTIRAQSPVCTTGPQEAENGILTGFEVGSDSAAANGAYIHIPDGGGSRWEPSAAFRAQYCFSVATDGLYRIEAGVWADTTTNDSFFVAIDGGMQGEGRWDVQLTTAYETDMVNSYRTADPVEVLLEAGDHMVDVYLREDGTRLDTIALIPVVVENPPSCTSGWVQAEAGVLTGFATARSGQSRYIHVPDGSGSRWQPSNDHRAVYCFEVGRAGVYRIEGRTEAPDFASDSFFVKVDDHAPFTWYVAGSRRFQDDYVNDWGQADPAEVWLEPGTHIVTVYAREDGTRLDRLRLREDRARGCASGRIEAEDARETGFEVGRAGAASGGEYLHVADGDGSSWMPSESAEIEFCFDVAEAGTYALHAGVWADTTTNDSFWVKVDGVVYGRWDTLLNTSYAEDVVGIKGGPDPLLLDLGPGDHTIEILLREDGTRLDWLGLEKAG